MLAIIFAACVLSLPLTGMYLDKSSAFRAQVKDYFHYRLDSFDSHILLIRGTFEIFGEFPVIGGGYGSFFEHFSNTKTSTIFFGRDPAGLNTRVPAHTIWGELLAETGVLGLTAFLLFTLLVVGTLFYAAFSATETRQFLLTTAMGSAIVGILTGGIFYSYKSEFFWLVLFLYFIYAIAFLKEQFDLGKIATDIYGMRILHVAFLLILGLFLIFINLGTNHFIPWDEAIYAKVAKNMVTTGDYVVLHWWHPKQYPDKIWLEKPPLYIWLAAGFMQVLGVNEWAARLPSAVFGLFTVLLVYAFAKKLFNNKSAALLSAFTLLTTFQFLYYARSAMLDVTTTFFITLSLYFYWWAKQESVLTANKKFGWLWIFAGVSAGLAIMTKGVIGFLPLLVIALYEIYLYLFGFQKFSAQKVANYISFVFASAAVFLPWHILMYQKFGRYFIDTYIGYHVLERATESIEDKGRTFWWYLIVLKVSMRIWFVALLGAFPFNLWLAEANPLRGRIKRLNLSQNARAHMFLVIYSLALFFFFSSAKSKLVWYIIPLYPPLAIIVGQFLERLINLVATAFQNLQTRRVFKFLSIFVIILFGIFYLALNRELVYTSDLTGKQVWLMQEKDRLFGTYTKLYADRIELPLILYYTDSPYEVVDFTPLKNIFATALPGNQIVFITKESRLRQFKELHPQIELVLQNDEWVLGNFVAK